MLIRRTWQVIVLFFVLIISTTKTKLLKKLDDFLNGMTREEHHFKKIRAL